MKKRYQNKIICIGLLFLLSVGWFVSCEFWKPQEPAISVEEAQKLIAVTLESIGYGEDKVASLAELLAPIFQKTYFVNDGKNVSAVKRSLKKSFKVIRNEIFPKNAPADELIVNKIPKTHFLIFSQLIDESSGDFFKTMAFEVQSKKFPQESKDMMVDQFVYGYVPYLLSILHKANGLNVKGVLTEKTDFPKSPWWKKVGMLFNFVKKPKGDTDFYIALIVQTAENKYVQADFFKNKISKDFSLEDDYIKVVKTENYQLIGINRNDLFFDFQMLEEHALLAELYNRLGLITANLGAYKESTYIFKNAIELTSTIAHYYTNIAESYLQSGDSNEAVLYINKGIELGTKFFSLYTAHIIVGKSYESIQVYTTAAKEFEKAIKLKPDEYLTYFLLGNIYFAQGYFQSAVEEYDKAINLNPTHAVAYHNKGSAFFNMEMKVEAFKILRKAMKLYRKQGNDAGVQQIQQFFESLKKKR